MPKKNFLNSIPADIRIYSGFVRHVTILGEKYETSCYSFTYRTIGFYFSRWNWTSPTKCVYIHMLTFIPQSQKSQTQKSSITIVCSIITGKFIQT